MDPGGHRGPAGAGPACLLVVPALHGLLALQGATEDVRLHAAVGTARATILVTSSSARALSGQPIRRAVGTSSSIGSIVALFGTIGFVLGGWGVPGRPPWSLGYVSGLGFLVIARATLLTAPLGTRIAHALAPCCLRRVFALFLAVMAVNFHVGRFG